MALAEHWRRTGDYRRASLLLQFALWAAERVHGPDSLVVAELCNQWGVLGKYTGAFERSGVLYQRALTIALTHFGESHDSVATICHNIGGLAHARGRFEEGEPWAARAVAVRTSIHGENHPLVMSDVVAWAALLAGLGQRDHALDLLNQALVVFTAVGDDHEIGVTLHNIAAIHHSAGEFRLACHSHARALAVKERTLGRHHPELAVSLVNAAASWRSLGDRTRAAACAERAVLLLEEQVRGDHPVLVEARRVLDVARQAAAPEA